MAALSYLKDKEFLRALDNESNKFYWVKIEVLDMDERPVQSIEGRVQPGSTISINGSSSVRRTCNINFIAEDAINDLTQVDNLLSINKKIRIFEGIRNTVNRVYDDIIWFPLGVYVISQPSISHTTGGCIISLSCKDKMCLLNGEQGGGLPTSITFHEYDQIIGLMKVAADPETIAGLEPNNYTIYAYGDPAQYKSWTKEYGWVREADASRVGERVSVPQLFYDIIQTLVCNYGNEPLSKIFINDVPLEIKQLVRYTGSDTLYYNSATGFYTTDTAYITDDSTWQSFTYNEDVGYVYTDFVYPGTLVSSIGENICSVLDKVKNTLGNYEYFYDIQGNFIFQEIKNYLNNSYDPTDTYRLDNNRRVEITENGLCILDDTNYKVDFYSNTRSVYTFEQGNGLISSVSNSPNYNNLKNDFHIWGEAEDSSPIHFHIAIKEKPQINQTPRKVVFNEEGGLRLAKDDEDGEDYVPADWRAELYLRGLEKWKNEIRPDMYEQELLDLFDIIYNFKEKKFKTDMVTKPNELKYFFDYLEPSSQIYDCSVDLLNSKIYSYQQDKIKRLYNTDVPNIIMINVDMDSQARQKMITRCENEGQPYSNVSSDIYSLISIGTIGYTAQEVARDLLYQYTNYNESISIQSVPIYYLDVNSRITVQDVKSGIYGDFIIQSITLPLEAQGTMSIGAVRALERI